ncbi:MAG TPA: DeoR/GlpR transcriptional regulator [Ruminococcaceae bacterium]|jgi:DeoR family fructose operon transcriptional repressor|nr:DeoR/GlpR transcriptional regulator [Oscillospiraceae bacterium]
MQKDRPSKIIEIMQSKHIISIGELSRLLNCTEMTVRRNLDKLQEMNFVRREHGYAVLLENAQETDYYVQIEENKKEKEAIASVALQYLVPFESICLDSGTTIQLMVTMIPKNMPLSVITPSLTAAMTLSDNSDVQVLIPTGFLNHANRSVLLAEPDRMRQYKADIAFISCRAFRVPGGAYEHTQNLTTTKKALAAIAQKRVLLVDYSKWDVNSLCNSISLEELDTIITDDKAPAESVKKAAEFGTEIIIVNSDTKKIAEHYNAEKKGGRP